MFFFERSGFVSKSSHNMSITDEKKCFYSQSGEDTRLADIFKGQRLGTCLEVGALDGVKDSTTYYFEKRGWSCVLVEANPELAERARENRSAQVFSCAAGDRTGTMRFLIAEGAEYLSTTVFTKANISKIVESGAVGKEITVPVVTVDSILSQSGVTTLDFVTVDVEGAELGVLRGFDLKKWNPRVLVLEDNFQGHDRRVRRYLCSQGYRCFLSDGLNDWYARTDDNELFTVRRRFAQFRRQFRVRLYEITVGLLPLAAQEKLVTWKRRYLGEI